MNMKGKQKLSDTTSGKQSHRRAVQKLTIDIVVKYPDGSINEGTYTNKSEATKAFRAFMEEV